MTEELKNFLIERNPRTTEPIQGEIDYDIPGKLIGNWFKEGTSGYAGNTHNNNGGGSYWTGHLSITPDLYDPTVFQLSFGSLDGKPQQYIPKNIFFDAAEIGIESGIVKVTLAQGNYYDSKGTPWDRNSVIKGPKLTSENSPSHGCVLFEVLKGERLQMEAFIQKECSDIDTFSDKARLYER